MITTEAKNSVRKRLTELTRSMYDQGYKNGVYDVLEDFGIQLEEGDEIESENTMGESALSGTKAD